MVQEVPSILDWSQRYHFASKLGLTSTAVTRSPPRGPSPLARRWGGGMEGGGGAGRLGGGGVLGRGAVGGVGRARALGGVVARAELVAGLVVLGPGGVRRPPPQGFLEQV